MSSNQTVAGLKQGSPDQEGFVHHSSNQTVAGLKRPKAQARGADIVSFKSDRCGIETSHQESITPSSAGSNQTVAGLKPHVRRRDRKKRPRSNQTVAGLKLCGSSLMSIASMRFKSDRCGIETRMHRKDA